MSPSAQVAACGSSITRTAAILAIVTSRSSRASLSQVPLSWGYGVGVDEGREAKPVDPTTAGVAKTVATATDAAASEAAKVAGNLFTRLLGPLTDEIGSDFAARYRGWNTRRVVERASAKAQLETEGAISMRVAAAVFESAQWAEEEFVTEYLSGVLAAARTPSGKNDGAVAWAALISRMPTTAIKLHYALYMAYRPLVVGLKPSSMNVLTDESYFLSSVTMEAVFLGSVEGQELQEAIQVLTAEGLIDLRGAGSADYLTTQFKRHFPQDGLVVRATPRGMSLILQVLGHPSLPESIVRPELAFDAVALEVRSSEIPAAIWVRSLPEALSGWTVI